MLNHALKSVNRHQWISEAAYYKALARKFELSEEVTNWLEAETDYYKMVVAVYISLLEEDGPMTMSGLQQLAEFIDIRNPKHIPSETELVGAIQSATGHSPCFRPEARMLCEEMECQWRIECRKLVSAWY